ncbi:MAG: diacylglycerol kinase family protein [Gemmatimonadaceae bacterium]
MRARSGAPRREVQVQRALLIVNPFARLARKSVRAATRAFAASGVQCETVITERRGHARDVALARSKDVDAVFTLGGDGTAVEVLGALAHTGRPVGILPGGTGNLLARAIGLPMNVPRAVRALVRGDQALVDLGRLADGSYFAIGAGVGIDAAMIAGTSQAWKRRAGVLSYVVAGASHVLRRRRFTARVTVDGVTVTREASVVLIANFGVLLNGLVTLGERIRRDDGRLDVCIFDPVTLPDVFRVSRKLMFRDFSPDSAMYYLQGSHIILETDPALVAQADGELIGNCPLEASVEPLAACLLVPQCQINRQ